SDRALRLESLHVQPEAESPAASHPGAGAVPLGRSRSLRAGGVRKSVQRPDSLRALRAGERGGTLSAHRAGRARGAPHRGGNEMRIYHFSEQPCPEAWDEQNASLRVNLASRNCDPRAMAEHYHHRLDEWLLADELGLDIMVNEHHATATCATPVAAVPLAILARQTKRARPLTLGYPIANRLDPVRLPEAPHLADRRALRERHFVGHAAHAAHPQAPARDDVDHRQLLGGDRRHLARAPGDG